MGVWIEIAKYLDHIQIFFVTPFMGVWIEINMNTKYEEIVNVVTPFMGVWIEIITNWLE